MNSIKITAILLAGLAAASPAAAVKHYVITDLGLAPGTSSSVARAISDNGKIAGEAGGQSANVGLRLDGGITVLPSLSGATNLVTRGINNAGQVAAIIQNFDAINGISTGPDRAALVTTGGATQLGGLSGYAGAGAYDVNNNGVAVGYALASGTLFGAEGSSTVQPIAVGGQKAVVWNGGVATALAVAGTNNSVAMAINDAGAVAGTIRGTNNRVHAVIWNGGSAALLGEQSGQTTSSARAISSTGWVAGQTSGSLGQLATVWSGSTTYTLGFVNAANTTATSRGINAGGTVVGFETDINGATNAVLWDFAGGIYTAYDLAALVTNAIGWDFSSGAPQAINDAGDIVGFARNADGTQHGYLLSAVPEPASWALMIGGFGMVGGALRRRRAVVA